MRIESFVSSRTARARSHLKRLLAFDVAAHFRIGSSQPSQSRQSHWPRHRLLAVGTSLAFAVLAMLILPRSAHAQEVGQFTLLGSGLPPGPFSDSSPNNPLGAGWIVTRRFTYALIGPQIPAGSVIHEVRFVRISSGTFSPGVIQARMRPLISNGVYVIQIVNGGPGPVTDPPDNSDLLDLYGIDQYAVGGTAVFTLNPFTNQPWTRADLDTLRAGFWVRWKNTTVDAQATQTYKMNDFGVEVVYTPLTLTVSPPQLAVSTGDTNRFIATTADPSSASISPTFTVGSYSNPNSNCAANLTFATATGVGSVNITVTGAPAGCSRIADNVRANIDTNQSTNSSKVIVPPQIMIKMVVGEAGGQPGDVDQQAILVSARNRFGDSTFPGGKTATWQAVVIPSQYYGASNPTENGPDQELANAKAVFTNETSDIVAGSKCYWSPTFAQWQVVQQTIQSGTTTFPANTGAPACWTASKRQIVYKASIGLNVSGGPNYQNAPAFVFVRQRQSSQPAAVQIP